MDYSSVREELLTYFVSELPETVQKYAGVCEEKMEAAYSPEATLYETKLMQYRTILSCFEPRLFRTVPFFFSTGTLKGKEHLSTTARFTYNKNEHLLWEQDAEITRRKKAQQEELFYFIGGPFNDDNNHFGFNFRPVLTGGLKSVYEKAEQAKKGADENEKRWLDTVTETLLTVKAAAERFRDRAREKAKDAKDAQEKAHYEEIAATASRIPWEKPETLREGLNVYLFLKEFLEAFEGISNNTFGRVDMDLYPLYRHDIDNGILTEETAYDLICRFLLCSDCRYDHDSLMEGAVDHELENTLLLGGCDQDGQPVYNELTRLFLLSAANEKIIYPKMFCRFSQASPQEYLDTVDRSIIAGTTTVLLENDDAVIPALLREGRPLSEARDYLVSGCWDVLGNGVEKIDSAAYFNMLATLECSIFQPKERMEKVGLSFRPLDGAESFEEVYQTVLDNIRTLMVERFRISHAGGGIWDQVDVLPLYSSTLADCLEKRRDFTARGARYHDEKIFCQGLPNIVDALVAIRKLCFEEKKYTLTELLDAVRENWEGHEVLRADVIRCPGWGDGKPESCAMAARFNDDLYDMVNSIRPTTYGGKIFLGHLTFTEIRFWGEHLLATPDGRKNGDYFSQGLTPSRLKKIPSSTSVIESLMALDKTKLAGNTVVNIILPSNKIDLDSCRAFLRVGAGSALMSLQLNCVTREQLLDAQKHPENHRDLIVRVTGFSARFTSLSPAWQKEVLSRNFYES